MNSTKRHINFTRRQNVTRDRIDIRMLEVVTGEPLAAKADLSLDGLGFPGDAQVTIEAYHRSSGQRFDCGTVANLNIPSPLVLNEVDRSGSVLFRIKVIGVGEDSGRILGSAERVQPKSDDEDEGRRSLFPVLFRDLGAETWQVDTAEDDDRPVLVLNKRITGISHLLQKNALLQGFLLPAALRIVLEKLVRDTTDFDDEPGWKSEWVEYCRDGLGMHSPAGLGPDDQDEWVDLCVRRFCELSGFVEAIQRVEEEILP